MKEKGFKFIEKTDTRLKFEDRQLKSAAGDLSIPIGMQVFFTTISIIQQNQFGLVFVTVIFSIIWMILIPLLLIKTTVTIDRHEYRVYITKTRHIFKGTRHYVIEFEDVADIKVIGGGAVNASEASSGGEIYSLWMYTKAGMEIVLYSGDNRSEIEFIESRVKEMLIPDFKFV